MILSIYTPICSAHGVPQSYISRGDLYQQHIEESVLLISDEVGHSKLMYSEKCNAIIAAYRLEGSFGQTRVLHV